MTRYLFAGGGTAGHVNPLLAVAKRLREREPAAEIFVLGTVEGLEARLVPEAGFELLTVAKVPFPRRPNIGAVTFPLRFLRSIATVREYIRRHRIEVVVGFGGYVSTPAYLAAKREGVPIVIHEANVHAGLANRWGSRFAAAVGVAIPGTMISNPTVVGMPLRAEIEELDRNALRVEAAKEFGFDPARKVLLVTGGSLGSRAVNTAILAAVESILATGWQVLHLTGSRSGEYMDPKLPGFVMQPYEDRMSLVLALADFAVSRAGASTVSELAALAIPAVFVPYPGGGGHQRYNVEHLVEAGAALRVSDVEFTSNWVENNLVPLLNDLQRVSKMADAAKNAGFRDGTDRMIHLIHSASI